MNKIRDPLQDGNIPPKVFLYAFGDKTYSYELAKKIHHPHSKITECIHIYKEYYHIEKPKKENGRYRVYFESKSDPLIKRMDFIKDEEDKYNIKTFLDSRFFRDFIKETNNTIIDFKCKINAYYSLIGTLSLITIFIDNLLKYSGKKWITYINNLTERNLKQEINVQRNEIKKREYLMRYVYSLKLLSTDYIKMSFIIGNTLFKCSEQSIDGIKELLPPDIKPYKNILTGFLDINTYIIDKISPYKHKSTRNKRKY